ncbi:hypothetical protein V8C35DRAFT_120988 [Trichoderma chlorosporum]
MLQDMHRICTGGRDAASQDGGAESALHCHMEKSSQAGRGKSGSGMMMLGGKFFSFFFLGHRVLVPPTEEGPPGEALDHAAYSLFRLLLWCFFYLSDMLYYTRRTHLFARGVGCAPV